MILSDITCGKNDLKARSLSNWEIEKLTTNSVVENNLLKKTVIQAM